MRIKTTVLLIASLAVAAGLLVGCSSPEKDAAKAAFNEQVFITQGSMDELSSLADQAYELAASEAKALDESLRTKLEVTAADAKTAVEGVEIPKMKSSVEDIEAQTEELKSIDLSQEKDSLEKAMTKFENSQKKYALVDNPSRDYILSCVGRVKGLDEIAYFTEKTDPTKSIGKSGQYYEKIVFHSVKVDDYGYDNKLLTLEEIGNPAGGCVEAYRTAEDAERRNGQLKDMEGTISAPGSHKVVGTLVIRTSDDLTVSQQKKLESSLVKELTRLTD